ncbi:unnamed protein product [Chilo suppressalis]|uniref:Rho-GAP domain-containing protein n=1 Tax=Chilo suppressalis TaxID=168631 RepID=A0ABN8L9B7_CHISP|nr:unnamed protein product [Chilo suppressalis]
MCEVTSWIPTAVADTLRAEERSAQPVIAWLTFIRASIEEYDPLISVRPQSPDTESSETSSDSPDSAFDEILSQLGKEIYKLEEFQNYLSPEEKEVSLSILNIFDECLEGMSDVKEVNSEIKTACIVELVNGMEECSDGESSLSDVSFVTSTPVRSAKDGDSLTDKGESPVNVSEVRYVPPVPPRRTFPNIPSPSSSIYSNVEVKSANTKCNKIDTDSDSESTCWSYKECSTDTETDAKDAYAAMWCQSSGFHNSDEILRRVLTQHYARVSRLSFHTANDFTPATYRVYSLQEVGDRCDMPVASPVANMTAGRPADDGYEPVRDAITDENIYEEIEYGCSFTDEGCSCGGSVEVESCSMSASSEGVGRESPLYANMRDLDAYAITPDVIYWKNMLLDPFYNDDEEDEWITPEECAVYSREQRPPLVIPRITQYRTPPRRETKPIPHFYQEDQEPASVKSSVRQYEQLQDWSPTSERSRADLERSFSKANSDSPPFVRINKRLGNSTENLLFPPRRPNHLQLPASSSGDSLDNVEVREHEPGYIKSRKSRSMVAPKHRMRSPVPAPRLLLHQPSETFVFQAPVVMEGIVKRTKFSESGKKSKKNWNDCYMVLTHTALIFFKDQKTYHATRIPKPVGTPPSPTAPRAELVLPLRNAHVVHCIQMHTRRFTKSMVLTVGYDQYLLQDETEEGAKRWLINIQNIIYKLGPPMPEEYQPQYLSSGTDLDSIGRTPPSTRHANRHRDEPVFGRKLEEVCPATSPRVPEFVAACVREIESSEENLCTDGLYRASGNLSQVQKIRLEIDQNNLSVIESNTDIHVLTGSLKLFFRELKEPLIPCNIFDRILAACSIKPREAKIKEFRDIVQALPQCNRDTLKFLLEHLLRVTQYSERNRMHTANLAIVFGPTLLWAPAEQAHNIAIDCIQQNNVVDILLNDFKDIFVDDNPKGKKKA